MVRLRSCTLKETWGQRLINLNGANSDFNCLMMMKMLHPSYLTSAEKKALLTQELSLSWKYIVPTLAMSISPDHQQSCESGRFIFTQCLSSIYFQDSSYNFVYGVLLCGYNSRATDIVFITLIYMICSLSFTNMNLGSNDITFVKSKC